MSAADGLTESEQVDEALTHFIETGHTIDSTDSPFRPQSPPAADRILLRYLLEK